MRYDLHANLGMDLNDWLRGDRDWRDLLDLLELLPDGAHYPAALLTDRELAELMLADEDEDVRPPVPDKHPPLRGYTPLIAKLDDVIDILIALQATTAHSDPRKAGRVPRPRTAVDVVRDERDSEVLSGFVDQLLGR